MVFNRNRQFLRVKYLKKKKNQKKTTPTTTKNHDDFSKKCAVLVWPSTYLLKVVCCELYRYRRKKSFIIYVCKLEVEVTLSLD